MNIQLATLSRYNWIDSGKVINNRVVLVTRSHFNSLIKEEKKFTEGPIDIKKYNVNFINKTYNN